MCVFFCHFSHTSKTNHFTHVRTFISVHLAVVECFSRTFSVTRTHFHFGLIIPQYIIHTQTHTHKGRERTPFHLCRRFILFSVFCFCYFRYCQWCVMSVIFNFFSPFFFVFCSFFCCCRYCFLFSLSVYFDIHWLKQFRLEFISFIAVVFSQQQTTATVYIQREEKESVNDRTAISE